MVHFPQIEFLDINLKQDSSLLFYAIHSQLYYQMLQKIILYLGYKNPSKNPQNKKTQVHS
jgi:hypothetical protein